MCSLSFQAVAKMVQECYKYVDAVTDLTIKLRLIDTLRTVTAGKVCVLFLCVKQSSEPERKGNLCGIELLSNYVLLLCDRQGKLQSSRLTLKQ